MLAYGWQHRVLYPVRYPVLSFRNMVRAMIAPRLRDRVSSLLIHGAWVARAVQNLVQMWIEALGRTRTTV